MKGKEFHYEKNNVNSSNSSSIKAYLKHHQQQQLINQYKQQQQLQQETPSEEQFIDTTTFNSISNDVKLTLEQQRLIKEKFLRDRHINHFDHRTTNDELHLRSNQNSYRPAQTQVVINLSGADVETSSKASSNHSKSTNTKVGLVCFYNSTP